MKDSLRWACGNTVPDKSSSIPLCLKVAPSPRRPKDPTQPLCLQATPMAAEDPYEYSPTWCYNRVHDVTEACSYYLWLSPSSPSSCTTAKCGPDWRLHPVRRDDNQSSYKLPTTPVGGDGSFDTLSRLPPYNTTSDDHTGWLLWQHEKSTWQNISMSIAICDDPVAECMIPEVHAFNLFGSYASFCRTRGGVATTSGGTDASYYLFLVAYVFGIVIFMVVLPCYCACKCASRSQTPSARESVTAGSQTPLARQSVTAGSHTPSAAGQSIDDIWT